MAMDDLLSETVSLSESELIAANPPEPKSIGSGIVKSIPGKEALRLFMRSGIQNWKFIGQ